MTFWEYVVMKFKYDFLLGGVAVLAGLVIWVVATAWLYVADLINARKKRKKP